MNSKFLLTLALVAFGAGGARAQTLTDLTLFRLDGANNTIAEGWNTRGTDGISNLYLLSDGSFVNSGNGESASVAIDLSVPGKYTFAFVGENVNANTSTVLGLNLFFNNNATVPGISARGTTPIDNIGSFVANGGITSLPNFVTVVGANTLAFNSGSRNVVLSAFSYQTNTSANQVTSFNNLPGGTADTIGSFTLTVSSVSTSAPEPSTLTLISFAALGLIARRRKSN